MSQQNLIKIRPKKKDDIIIKLRKRYVKGNIHFAAALNKKVDTEIKAHRKGEIDKGRRRGLSSIEP